MKTELEKIMINYELELNDENAKFNGHLCPYIPDNYIDPDDVAENEAMWADTLDDEDLDIIPDTMDIFMEDFLYLTEDTEDLPF